MATMKRDRLEAFSDGVLAIVITIMVLELKVPHGDGEASFAGLLPLWPVFVSYVLSFVYLGIYWNNHHHLLHAVPRVTGAVLWANLHLLFWLSLVPFATAWMGEHHFAPATVALYGGILLMNALAYLLLQRAILAVEGCDGVLARAIGEDWKGKLSIGCYVASVPLAFWLPWLAGALFGVVALIWLVPDRRIERALGDPAGGDD